MTSVRHGHLWGDDAASGWVRMTCDCGWRGTALPATLYAIEAIEEYGDHRAQAEREATDVVADAPDSATDNPIGAET